MKILIPGYSEHKDAGVIFKCGSCSCVFEAFKGEYVVTDYWSQMHDAIPPYNCSCPTCGQLVYSSNKRTG